MESIGRVIPMLHEKFDAPDPYAGDIDGFIERYWLTCKRNSANKIFPDFVFQKFFAVE